MGEIQVTLLHMHIYINDKIVILVVTVDIILVTMYTLDVHF